MEGGSNLVLYLTYAILGVVLVALLVVTVRTLLFALGLLALPLADVLRRWGPGRRWLERWAARGAVRDPDLWRSDEPPRSERDAG
jgi:hypothetical protein